MRITKIAILVMRITKIAMTAEAARNLRGHLESARVVRFSWHGSPDSWEWSWKSAVRGRQKTARRVASMSRGVAGS